MMCFCFKILFCLLYLTLVTQFNTNLTFRYSLWGNSCEENKESLSSIGIFLVAFCGYNTLKQRCLLHLLWIFYDEDQHFSFFSKSFLLAKVKVWNIRRTKPWPALCFWKRLVIAATQSELSALFDLVKFPCNSKAKGFWGSLSLSFIIPLLYIYYTCYPCVQLVK